MKSKLIKYPYAKPQYHWDRTGFDTDVTYNWDYTVDETTEKDIPIKNARKLYRQNGDVTIGVYPRYYYKYGEIPKEEIQEAHRPSGRYVELSKPIGRDLKKLELYITYDEYYQHGEIPVPIGAGDEYYSFSVSDPKAGLTRKATVKTFENYSAKAYSDGPYSSSVGEITLTKDDTKKYYINLAEFMDELPLDDGMSTGDIRTTINYYDKPFHNATMTEDEPIPVGQVIVDVSLHTDGDIGITTLGVGEGNSKYTRISPYSRSGDYGVQPNSDTEPSKEFIETVDSKELNKIHEDIENTIWNLITDREGEGNTKGYQTYHKEYWNLTYTQFRFNNGDDSLHIYKMEFTGTDEQMRKEVASHMNLVNYYPVIIKKHSFPTGSSRVLCDYYHPIEWGEIKEYELNQEGSIDNWKTSVDENGNISSIEAYLYCWYSWEEDGHQVGEEKPILINRESNNKIYPYCSRTEILDNNRGAIRNFYNNFKVHFEKPNERCVGYIEDPITRQYPELAHLTAEELEGYIFMHYDEYCENNKYYRPTVESFTDGVATISNYYLVQKISEKYYDVLNKYKFIPTEPITPDYYRGYGKIQWKLEDIDNYKNFDTTYYDVRFDYNNGTGYDMICLGLKEIKRIGYIQEDGSIKYEEYKQPEPKEYKVTSNDGIVSYLSDIMFTCSWAEAAEFCKKHLEDYISEYIISFKTNYDGEILGDHMPPDTIDFGNKPMYYIYTAPESNNAKISDVYQTRFTAAELEALENCVYDGKYLNAESGIYKEYPFENMNPINTYEIHGDAHGTVSSKDPTTYPLDGTVGLYTYKYSHSEFNGYIRNNTLYDVVMNENEYFLPKTETINQQLYVWMMKEMVDGALVDLYKVYSARRHTYPDNGEYEGKYYEFLPEDSTGDGTDSYVQVYGDLWYGEAIADIIPELTAEIDSSLIWRNPVYDKIINNTASINYDTIAAGSLEIDTRLTLQQANALIGSMLIYLVDFQNSDDWVYKGFFWIDGVENTGPAHVKIYAHDQVYKLNKYVDDWVGTLTYPMTLNSYYHALLDYCDIYYDAKEDKILNGDFPIYNNFTAVKLTATELMKYITELAGGYFHTDRYNKAHISSYTPNPKVYDYSEYNYLNYSSYNSDLFNEFKFIRNNKIYYDKKIEPENEPKVIFIKDNPLVGNDNLTTQIDAMVDNIYNQTSTQLANYRNGTIKFFADFGVKIGDIIGIMAYDETQEAPMSFIKMAIMSEHIDDNGITYESYGELEYPIESDGTRTSITYTDAINLEDTNKQVNTNSANISTMAQSMNTLINNLEDTNKQVNTNSTNISTMAQSMNTLINNQNTYSVSSANGLGTVVLNGTLNNILLKTYADSTYNKKTEPISSTQINDGSIPIAKINPDELNQFVTDKVATTNCVAHGSFSWLGKDKPHWNLYLGSFDESGEHFMNGLVISAGGNLTNDNKYYHIISNIDFIIQGTRIYSADNLNGPAIPKSSLEGK